MTGAVGSLLLDWYGWPSVFYFSGGLTLLWVGYVYRCLLSERGTCHSLGSLGGLVHSWCLVPSREGPLNPESRWAQGPGAVALPSREGCSR